MSGMGDRAAKDALFDAFAEIAVALASGRRTEIVDLLAQGERSVDEIAGEVGQSLANTSHHLRTLARAGLVSTRRDGTRIHYRLASDRVSALWAALRDVAVEHVAGIDALAAAYLGDRSELVTVDRAELAALVAGGDVIVLDVRPAPEFAAGHIPGAWSVPPGEVQRRLGELPKDTAGVGHFRRAHCGFARHPRRGIKGHGPPAPRGG